MGFRDRLMPPGLSRGERRERVALGLTALGATAAILSGSLGVKNSIDGQHAMDRARKTDNYALQAANYDEASNNYGEATEYFLVAGMVAGIALGGVVVSLRARIQFSAIEEDR